MATEAEKTQLKKDAKTRAVEQKAAVQAKDDQIASYRQSVEETAKGTQAVQPGEPTEAFDEALEEFGPYPDNRTVTTTYGDYGVPYREVLFFVETEVFDTKINRMVKIMKNHLRKATKEEMEPIRAQRAAKKAALAGRA